MATTEAKDHWGKIGTATRHVDAAVICDACGFRKVIALAETLRAGDWAPCRRDTCPEKGEPMRLMTDEEMDSYRLTLDLARKKKRERARAAAAKKPAAPEPDGSDAFDHAWATGGRR